MRECTKWDSDNNRFLVSHFEGGIGEIGLSGGEGLVLEEKTVVKDADLAGNASLGFTIDRHRNRILVAVADVLMNKYSALAAYDLTTWNRLFLAKLSGPEDGKAFADDVAVDADGNSYITDVKASKIWKVGVNGEYLGTIESPLFTPKEWYKNLVGLNGIVYHPDGYLLVIHTFSGNLYKIGLGKGDDQVKLVKLVEGSLAYGDGLDLLSPNKLVAVGMMGGKLVESTDGWETARVASISKGITHRLPTAATVKDGKVYLNHMIGLGYPRRKHVLAEAVF